MSLKPRAFGEFRRFRTWRAGALAISLLVAGAGSGQEKQYDDSFPPAMQVWQKNEALADEGVPKAEKLRQVLLTPTADGQLTLEVLCGSMRAFREAVSRQLPAGDTLDRFVFSATSIKQQLQGQHPLDAKQVFAAFDGRWYGLWDQSPVNHDWQPTTTFQPARPVGGTSHGIAAWQYAWIGNGFGWNYLVHLEAEKNRPVVLGMVYYLVPADQNQIVGRKPHVGYVDGPTRLIWITEREVFFEEVLPADEGHVERYVITALYHKSFDAEPSVSPDAGQAVYTRDAQSRPQFRHFQWRPTRR
jgi:hypothetical protein